MRSYKTEIELNKTQIQKFNQTVGVCRYIYNFYIAHNRSRYVNGEKFMSRAEFIKWLNNEFIPKNEEYIWIKSVSSKSVIKAVMNAENAYKRYLKGQSNFPKFKRRKDQNVKMYFVRNEAKKIIQCARHRIKIPTLGWVKLKEKNYLPTNGTIISGAISQNAGRYYIAVMEDSTNNLKEHATSNGGMGIDLGIKDFAIVSNQDKPIENINKSAKVRKHQKSLKRQQRKLSRKFESMRKSKTKEKEHITRINLQKQILRVQKLHQRISNIRENHINQTVNSIVKQKPSFIAIEDLNIRGLLKNKHLAKAVAQQRFNQFRLKLKIKCISYGIELRIVDRFYPSSKLCSSCGKIKKDLKLSDRTYICDCGHIMDRDMNAAINLRNAKVFTV